MSGGLNLLTEVLCVRVTDRIAEVIFLSHTYLPYCLRSFGVALRAEIILITSSSSRYA